MVSKLVKNIKLISGLPGYNHFDTTLFQTVASLVSSCIHAADIEKATRNRCALIDVSDFLASFLLPTKTRNSTTMYVHQPQKPHCSCIYICIMIA